MIHIKLSLFFQQKYRDKLRQIKQIIKIQDQQNNQSFISNFNPQNQNIFFLYFTGISRQQQFSQHQNVKSIKVDSSTSDIKLKYNMYSSIKIPLQLQRQRQQRHNKLMNMINSYELTKQQKVKLEKIKSHTMLEINLRYLRSEVNRHYNFPKSASSVHILNHSSQKSYSMTQEDEEEDKLLRKELEETQQSKGKTKKKPSQYFIYDLRSQNQNKFKLQIQNMELKTYSTKILSLEQSRRVHSLGNDKSLQKQKADFLTKKHSPIRNSSQRNPKSPEYIGKSKSSKSIKTIKPISLTRRSSKQNLILEQSIQKLAPIGINSKRVLVQSKKLKLPEINLISSTQSKSIKKLSPFNQKLKTEKFYEEEDIQYAIGKKLVTQISDSGKKVIKGVQKYLKQLETQKQQLNFNNFNKGSSMMKKDKSQQKRKVNYQIFKSAKHSIKRQIQ